MRPTTMIFKRSLSTFLSVSVLTLTGCATGGGLKTWDSAGPTAAAQETPQGTLPQIGPTVAPSELPAVKVALLVPLTGRNAQLGQAMLDAAQMAIFDVGYSNFELLPRDTKGTAEGAAAAARDATTAGAQLVLGPIFADEVRAVKPTTGASHISTVAFSTNWELADDTTYLMGFMPFDQVERIATFAAVQGYKNVAVVAPATDYGRTVASAFQTMAKRLSLPTSSTITLNPSQPNTLAALGQTKYDAVFMPFGGSDAVKVSAALDRAGLPVSQVRRLGTGLFDDAAVGRNAEMNGALFAAPSPTQGDTFERRFFGTYNYNPPRLASLAYDATALAASLAQRGFQQKGSPAFDRPSITNPNGFSGLDGIFRFRQNGLAERGLAVLQFSNGQITVADPAPRTFQ